MTVVKFVENNAADSFEVSVSSAELRLAEFRDESFEALDRDFIEQINAIALDLLLGIEGGPVAGLGELRHARHHVYVSGPYRRNLVLAQPFP